MDMLQGYILLVTLVNLISGSLADQQLLPAPENISIVSINLKHFLHWDPVTVLGNVTYSVESQGEYESIYMKHYWHETEKCQKISVHRCNVTAEVSASVLYKFRVRSELGNQHSSWAELEPPFHRKTTHLIPPTINLQVSGLNLVAYIEDYGPNFHFFIFYWQKGKEDNMKCKKTISYDSSIFLEKAEEGKEYCAEVIAHASSINKNSSGSQTVCIQVQGRKQSGLYTGLLCVFGIVLAFVPIFLAVWKSATVIRYFCCPDEDIPDVLKEPNVHQKMFKNYYSVKDKSQEINSVELHEELLSEEKNSFTIKMEKL
ncbi:interleukin-20 receptor subunit beta [Dendrobates tinctorius]|uniref:interleukin-20 receptor subunit beta n=1 Tax=Dendrobates tinctorius TaxID=92724 RepID=UPI003CC9E120